MSEFEGSPPVWSYVRGAWQATASQRVRAIICLVLLVLAPAIDLLIPWALGYTIDAFIKHGVTATGMWMAGWGLLAFVGLRFAFAIFNHVGRYLQITTAYNAKMHTLEKIFAAIFKFPLYWHTKTHSGENLSKLNRAAGAVDNAVGTYIWLVLEGAVKAVMATVIIIVMLDFWVALNVFLMCLLTLGSIVAFNKRLTARYRQNNIFSNKINRICIDYLFNVVTIKTLGLEQAAARYLDVQREEGYNYSRKIAKYNELKWGSTNVGYTLMMSTSLMIYFWKLSQSGAPFEVQPVWVMISYLDKIFQAVTAFTGYYSGIIESAIAFEDGSKILKESAGVPTVSTTPLQPGWQTLYFNKLQFSYLAGEVRGLQDISFSISPNEKIALVGPSGGGKSTLLKVIGGMLLAESGSASIETGQEFSLAAISQSTLMIPQEPEIFSETFRYNITMGENFSDEKIRQYIQLARLEGVIEKLPDGQATDMAEKGLNMSVGEKQRLALVRGLLRAQSRQIILLDEPTSSLDPKTEKEIFLSLLEHFSDRVIMTACHRLNIVPLFDRVIFVRDGMVLESGSFSELLRKGGAFAEAWEDYEKKVPKQSMG